ncbi:hypothetical protein J6Z39_09300, partial [bacterium]|nr:hypothetical protein [bacterium]
GTKDLGDLGDFPFLDRGFGKRQKCFTHKKSVPFEKVSIILYNILLKLWICKHAPAKQAKKVRKKAIRNRRRIRRKGIKGAVAKPHRQTTAPFPF